MLSCNYVIVGTSVRVVHMGVYVVMLWASALPQYLRLVTLDLYMFQVVVALTPASLPFFYPPQLRDVCIETSKATYSLSKMLGKSSLSSNSAWRHQDAEILVAAINRHLQLTCDFAQTKDVVMLSRTSMIQNDLRTSVLSCMHRLGSCFESCAQQQRRLGGFADSMLEQQRLLIESLFSEQEGLWGNVCRPEDFPVRPAEANAEYLFIEERSYQRVHLVYKQGVHAALAVVLLAVAGLGAVMLWVFLVTDLALLEELKRTPGYLTDQAREMQQNFGYHRGNFHTEVIQELAAAWTATISASCFVLIVGLDMCAIAMLVQDAVRVSCVVVHVGKGVWRVQRVSRWTLRPKDEGIGCLRCRGASQKAGFSRWGVTEGEISTLRGCEVRFIEILTFICVHALF